MVDQEKLKWIWDNVNLIYLNLGSNYFAEFKDITIMSSDNYFKCRIHTHYYYLVFTLEKEFSLINEPKYFLHTTNFNELDDVIKVLKPIFRDFKIEMISE